MTDKQRCWWCGDDPLYVAYHDTERGVPTHDDRELFAMLVLEWAQAGLSWYTVLKKRDAYYELFDDFDPVKVAAYGDEKKEKLLGDARIIRNKLKVWSAVKNAQAFLAIQQEYGSFDAYLWWWVDGKTIVNRWESLGDVPASTELSEMISKDLKKRGMTFVWPTIIYAYLQSVGIVNDHLVSCWRHGECE